MASLISNKPVGSSLGLGGSSAISNQPVGKLLGNTGQSSLTNQPVGATVGLGTGPSAITNQSSITNQPVGATLTPTPTVAQVTTSPVDRHDDAAATNATSNATPISISSFNSELDAAIDPNPLNKYYNPTYHFTLFMAGDGDILQNVSDVGQLANSLNNISQVVVAESGVTGYNIKSVEIDTVISQNGQTRDQKGTRFVITVTEPIGVSFLDAVYGAAQYLKVFDYTKMVYYLHLRFTGYDENGKFAGNPLPLGARFVNGSQWIWAMTPTIFNTKINEGGGVYTLNFVAIETEPLIVESKKIGPMDASITAKGKKLGDLFDDFANKLTEQWQKKIVDKKTGGSLMKFSIKTHPIPWANQADPKDFLLVNKVKDESSIRALTLDNVNGTPTATIPPGVSVNEFITSAIKATEQGQELIKDEKIDDNMDSSASQTNPKKFRTVTMFTIEPRIEHIGKDPQTGNYVKNITFHVTPSYSQNVGTLTRTQVQNATDPNVQREMVQKLIQNGFVRKRYNYIFTGLNTEVLDFHIDFNLSWQATLPKLAGNRMSVLTEAVHARYDPDPRVKPHPDDPLKDKENVCTITALTPLAQQQAQQQTRSQLQTLQAQNPQGVSGNKIYLEDILTRLNQGQPTTDPTANNSPNGALPISFWPSYLDTEREAGIGLPGQDHRGLSTVGAIMAQAFDRTRTTAFQSIELNILGDPYWLGQTNLQRQIILKQDGSIVNNPADIPDYSSAPTAIINFKYPLQIGDDFKPILKNSEVFNGMYEVTRVKHNFADGSFKQTVHGVRMGLINLNLASTASSNSTNTDATSSQVAGSPSGDSGQPSSGSTPGSGSSNPSDPRGIRNNNPTNLSYVSGQPGVTGSDGRFGTYATMDDGIGAAQNQLLINQNDHGLTTVAQQITRWAPPGENNTTAYINTVSQKLGVGPNDTIDVSNPQTAQVLLNAQIKVETGRTLDPTVIANGISKGTSYYNSQHS